MIALFILYSFRFSNRFLQTEKIVENLKNKYGKIVGYVSDIHELEMFL